MDIRKKTFITTDEQYGSGLCLDDYNDQISICSAHKGEDDSVYLDWIFPQGKDRKPIEKSLPWKINLGHIDMAKKILTRLLKDLDNMNKDISGQPEPVAPVNNSEDDVPF